MELSSISKEKNELRIKYKIIRKNINSKLKINNDTLIKQNLTNLKEYINSDIIFIYVSKEEEVDTINIIKDALNNGKKVACPCYDNNTGNLKFYYIKNLNDLLPSYFDINEPDKNKCEYANSNKNAVCIIPGIAFDEQGYRIGFGKGCYDKFLSNFSGVKIGLCYEECTLKNIPHDNFDCKVDILITQKGAMYINNL